MNKIFIVVAAALAVSPVFAQAPDAAKKTAQKSAHAAKAPHTKFTANQAKSIAMKKYPGKLVGKVQLENEEGSWQYAVSIKSKGGLVEVMVDANTGKIANVEKTTAAEEAKEAKETKKK